MGWGKMIENENIMSASIAGLMTEVVAVAEATIEASTLSTIAVAPGEEPEREMNNK